jgi:hypothetical protein
MANGRREHLIIIKGTNYKHLSIQGWQMDMSNNWL